MDKGAASRPACYTSCRGGELAIPWKVYQEGDEFCVFKLKDDGSKGTKVPGGCHSSKEQAEAHKRALYANEPSAQVAASVSLVTIPDVPIVEVGMDYPAMTGPVTFTFEQMRDAVVAYQNDDAIVAPRLKLGHMNGIFKSGDMPAVGLAENLRLENDGGTVVADYVGVPAWLAEVMPYAYPSRSIEGSFDVETTTGKKWQFVITDLALLGVSWPGVMTIDDLPKLYGNDLPEQVELSDQIKEAMEGGGVGRVAAAVNRVIRGQVNVKDVEREFYNEFAQDERYWWYIVASLIDPMELIVEDDEGKLQRLPVEVSGRDVTFGEPSPVMIEFVDEAAAQSIMAEYGSRVAAAYKTREASGAHASNREGGAVDTATLRKTLNLPDDTPDAEVLRVANERLAEAPAGDPPPTPEGEPAPEPEEGEETPGETPEEGEETPEPEAQLPLAASVVTIDAGTLAELKADAKKGREARDLQLTQADDRLLNDAVEMGKIPPSRREHWKALLQADREGTIAMLGTLAENVIPINARAIQEADDGEVAGGYPAHWLPEVAAAKAAAAQGDRPRIQMEV